MSSYTTNDIRSGVKLLLDNAPCSIIEVEFVKPGKGQAFARVKLRNLLTGRIMERTFKSGEKFEGADIIELELQYLYNDGEKLHFMHSQSFEQYEVEVSHVQQELQWLKEQDMCTVMLWNDNPISMNPPNFVELKIVETDPGLKGDTSGGGSKPAKLETGAVVKVPLFVQEGEIIKVDTRTGEYLSRVKK